MKPFAPLKTVFFLFLFTFCVRQPAIEDPSPEEVEMVNEIQEPEQSTTASSTEETTTSSNTNTTNPNPPSQNVSPTSVGGNAFEHTSPIILGYFPSWSEEWTSRGNPSKLRNIPLFVNHVFLGFAKPNLRYEKGSYDLSATRIEVPYSGCDLKESVSVLREKGINVILSVGGETYWRDASAFEIEYEQIKALVDDIGFAGIDWDFEPDGSFTNIGNTENVAYFIDFFKKSRALMPQSEGYLLACAPAGVGALGGQQNNDPDSPFRFENRNTLTGENDDKLYQGTQVTNGINLFGFSSTGHMIPVFKEVGDLIDLVALQGYNTGASTNRSLMYDAYAHYAELYGFSVAAGVHYPDEPWGPYYKYTHETVASLSEHIRDHTDRKGSNDGIMIWQLLLEGPDSSAYSYLNTAALVLGGTDKMTAIAQANNFSDSIYKGEGVDCMGSGGGNILCDLPVYSTVNQYPNAGTQVVYNCKIWKSKWWVNPNEAPGENEAWEVIGDCNEAEECGN
jgi:chitinase